MQYRLVIFDLDGTILDTLQDLCDSVNFSLKAFQMSERSLEQVRCFVGNGIRQLIERSVPDGTDEKTTDAVFYAFMEHYSAHCADKTVPYPGIEKTLLELKRRQLMTAVFSNKADAVVRSLCDKYFPGLFSACIGERADLNRKPSPDGIFALQNMFSVSKEEILYIGDSDVDAKTAENAGVDLLLADWGFRSREMLLALNVGKVIHCPQDILAEIL